MTNTTLRDEVLKSDAFGRVRTPRVRREAMVEEFEKSVVIFPRKSGLDCWYLVEVSGYGFLGGRDFFEVERRTITEAAVAATAVVKGFDVVEGHELSGGAGGCDGVAEAFGFEGGDEAFCQGVVVGIGRAAHAQRDAADGGEPGEVHGGVLDAAIAVVEQAGRWRLAMNGMGEGRGSKFAAHVLAAAVSDAALTVILKIEPHPHTGVSAPARLKAFPNERAQGIVAAARQSRSR